MAGFLIGDHVLFSRTKALLNQPPVQWNSFQGNFKVTVSHQNKASQRLLQLVVQPLWYLTKAVRHLMNQGKISNHIATS